MGWRKDSSPSNSYIPIVLEQPNVNERKDEYVDMIEESEEQLIDDLDSDSLEEKSPVPSNLEQNPSAIQNWCW